MLTGRLNLRLIVLLLIVLVALAIVANLIVAAHAGMVVHHPLATGPDVIIGHH